MSEIPAWVLLLWAAGCSGGIIFIAINLPYARALEYGHSQQAPGGMIRITVQRWKPIVEAVARELNKQ